MKKIHILGLGALGSNIISQLVTSFPDDSFVGYDYDKVEERNLRTQFYFAEHLRMPKTQATMVMLNRLRPGVKYQPVNKKLTGPHEIVCAEDDLILDCFDNVEARNIAKKVKCKNILHVSFHPQFLAELQWNEGNPVFKDPKSAIDICELEAAAPFIKFCAAFTVIQIIAWKETGKKKDFLITEKTKIREL